MIFLTVGSELPFDRLVAAVDRWAETRKRSDIFGQVARIQRTGYKPQHFEWAEFLSPSDYRSAIASAHCVVSHAGVGSIIETMKHRKPLLVMPRRADLHETRNDHQIATADKFSESGIRIATDEGSLLAELDIMDTVKTEVTYPLKEADPRLIETIRNVILSES